MEHYCTYFDISYLSRAITLYQSMLAHCDSFELYCVCMDDATYDRLKIEALPAILPIHIRDLLERYDRLERARQHRSLVEFYFTATPSVIHFILEAHPEIRRLTYLDADLYFFSSPAPVLSEVGYDSAAGIIEHRHFGLGKIYLKYGIYNVGWLTFNRKPEGMRCLMDWQSDCFAWCFDRVEGKRYGDQKYLNQWPEKYPSVRVISHIGANVGPWNVGQYKITKGERGILVDGVRVIFYHFASLKRVSERRFETNTGFYFVRASRKLVDEIYQPYVVQLWATSATARLLVHRE